MTDITPIVLILIAIIGIVGCYYVLPYIKAKTEALKANMSASDWDELCKWVSIGVKAAEQLFPESGQGVSKKEFVWNWLKKNVLSWLEQRNITFDMTAVDAIIESEVFKLNLTSRYVGVGEIMEGVAILEDPAAEPVPVEDAPVEYPVESDYADDDPVPTAEPQDPNYKVPFTVPQTE